MRDTKIVAERLVARFKTRNPFEIAEYLDLIVLNVPLNEVEGFTQKIGRQSLIYLADDLSPNQRKLVCAHELGHICMHDGLNRIYLARNTQAVLSRYEVEAQHFAVDLLFDDYDLQDYLTYPASTVAKILGIEEELARYRMENVNPRLIPSW